SGSGASPRGSATASPSGSATASSATASPSLTPSPSPAAIATPSQLAAPAPAAVLPPAVDVQRLITASSLAALVAARTQLARTELSALEERLASLQEDHATAAADLGAFSQLIGRRSQVRDRLLRDGLRVASADRTPPPYARGEERDAIDDQIALSVALREREARLAADEADLASTVETVTAKRDELARLERHARVLVTASGGAAELALLRSLADDASAAANAIAELTRDASGDSARATWRWPIAGAVTQTFGPSALTLEPALTFRGIFFEHFHDAIDIGAPLGTAVVAASSGRVTFVGHLPDGAMVVVIAHDDGLVSLSAHLDDTFAPPPVRGGQAVSAGQVIGYVGLTGMTTGPHLHFAVHDATGAVDPLAVIERR
ncbi:MAG TPA: M23 family metallopeptidase, partial [Candidatus Limnocylindrales bacterium]|nr:M23 family metallopeptidase [Candidatus Limnocylindrales bacterium]